MNNEKADTPCWYLIHTQPKQEDRADSNLRAWGVETFFPRLKDVRVNKYTGQLSYVVNPLFPRYLFARFSANDLYHKVVFTRGVQYVVSFGSGPAPVDENVISIVRLRVGEDGYVQMGGQFEPGDHVIIEDSSLRNLTGIFEREVKNSDRVLILLQAMGHRAHVEVERSMVRKVC